MNVNAGGAFDLVGIGTANVAGGFGARTFNIAGAGPTGAGALVDTGLAQQNAFQSVTLGADATVGGTARWDLRGGAAQLDLGNFTLTKVGTNHHQREHYRQRGHLLHRDFDHRVGRLRHLYLQRRLHGAVLPE